MMGVYVPPVDHDTTVHVEVGHDDATVKVDPTVKVDTAAAITLDVL